MTQTPQPTGPEQPEPPLLTEPAGGTPPVTDTPAGFAAVAERFAAGTGPVALDAERASGHRYGQRAFLIQAKREGAGIALLDPEALGGVPGFPEAISGAEWILHSATQDLPCLADLGLRPAALFDTELAARLLNMQKVGLAGLTESLLGWRLSKGHSAADWSVRPLPDSYLRYAALDVELLLELREVLRARLAEAGKLEWAEQEFAALARWEAPVRAEPWRRTSGMHKVRDARGTAIVRELWLARDRVAQEKDRGPGRVLPDAAIVAAAKARPTSRDALRKLPEFARQRRLGTWWSAVAAALAVPEAELPPIALEGDGPPATRLWARRDPAAAERYQAARGAVLAVSEARDVPAEVLIPPDAIRRLTWQPPDSVTLESVTGFLVEQGARPWQVAEVAGPVAEALAP